MKLKYKVAFVTIIMLAIVSWIIAIIFWGKLPEVIPIHFGVSGMADGWADKSVFMVYLMPLLQSLMIVLFAFVYHKPQYSNLPSTMWLATLDPKHKNLAYDLIRTMDMGVAIFAGALFTYMTYGMNMSAIDPGQGLENAILFLIVGLMMVWIIYWTIKIYRITKKQLRVRDRLAQT